MNKCYTNNIRIEEVHSTKKSQWVAKKMNHASVRKGAGEEEKMSDLKLLVLVVAMAV